ncbi:choline ABC transporter ATP-binding protein [Amphritea pacifica]|uniref:Choline ABC transporter ATP-binding protein n=1 Tax=Amphritea pacifica TaxID=2811233 RepID=A0ABS2W8D2_9GAMM|nr:choline ABC transporter ATP-binding protein [Amphritea pacifica]MBN0987846.1 choline ABC transporter ATP-binding protein [Amphritea pacifica]MBN1008405.1 choline ABC transporter ATP-binding protein [Amphritea pacifica]
MSAISIRNLDVVFGDKVEASLKLLDQGKTRQEIIDLGGNVVGVHNASIDVAEGEICVLMGLSGSGKSSLLRAVNGLNPISRGELLVRDGEQMVDIGSCDETTLRHMRTRRISMVFQNFALMPWLTVLDNVAFGLEMQGMGKQERRAKAMEKLEMVGLHEWSDKYAHELSGGMQQRVGLARAFAMDSDILLMDEPFSALDPLIRSQLQDELIELQQRLNKTILFVSHDLDEALKIGTNIAIMESAKIIQHGRPEDIVLNPVNHYVEQFVAHTNPLNVLKGRSLMTNTAQLERLEDMLVLNRNDNTCISTNTDGQVISASRQGKPLALHHWQEGQNISQLPEDTLVMATPDISMRQAIEIRYRTGHPVLLNEKDSLIGILSDKDFYHALLGKHFTTTEAGMAGG